MKLKANFIIIFPVVVLGLILGNIFISYSSNKINDSCQSVIVRELVISDTNIYSILQRILYEEKKNNTHFSDSTIFGVWVEESPSKELLLVTISGTDNLNMLVQSGNLEGFFKYKGHYFILMTECSKLFRASDKYQTLGVDLSLDIYEDDRWPFHYIKYYHGAFVLVEQ